MGGNGELAGSWSGCLLRQIDQVFLRDVGDGYRRHILDGDDDTQVLLETLDATLDTGKGALGNLHQRTGPAGKVEIVEEDHLIGGYGRHPDEVVHLGVGDVEDLGLPAVIGIDDSAHDIAQRLVELFVGLDDAQVLKGDADKDEVADGWYKSHCRIADQPELHRHEGLKDHVLVVEERFQAHQAGRT